MLSQEKILEIQQMYLSGLNKSQISTQLHIAYSTVQKYCKDIVQPNNMIGKKFGDLTIISLTDPPKEYKNKQKWYECQCICGAIKKVSNNDLKTGKITSCGCQRGKKRLGSHNFQDLTNQRFGKLVAVKPLYKLDGTSMIWECKCDCGKTVQISAHHLKQGQKSCGCLTKTPRGAKHNLIGQKIDSLTILEETSQRLAGHVILKCRCDCGNICYVSTKNIGKNTHSCGCLRSLGEQKIINCLSQLQIPYIKEYVLTDVKGENGGARRVDFAILDTNHNIKCFIEYQGKQHYEKNNPWYRPNSDTDKQNYCKM